MDIDIHRLAQVFKNTPANPGNLESFDPTKFLKVEKILAGKVGFVEILLRSPVNLEEVYAKKPYSPPPPVGEGSLIVASWDGHLCRAKVFQSIEKYQTVRIFAPTPSPYLPAYFSNCGKFIAVFSPLNVFQPKRLESVGGLIPSPLN